MQMAVVYVRQQTQYAPNKYILRAYMVLKQKYVFV